MAGTSKHSLHNALERDPDAIRALFRGLEVYPDLDAIDLREMGKFTEQTNIHGLPVHPIIRPVRTTDAREYPGTLEDFPSEFAGGATEFFRTFFSEQPSILVRGELAAGCSRPFRIAGMFPQSQAHLAHGFTALTWPATSDEGSDDLYLIQWPDSPEQWIVHMAGSKLVIALGTDDLRAGLIFAIESAHRLWTARTEAHAAAQEIQGARSADKFEEIRLLPGGCFFVAKSADDGTLIFTEESIPDQWDRHLAEKADVLHGVDPVEIVMAGAEPWVAEGGARVCPFWANPPLPIGLLAHSERWTEAALHPDALPFGVTLTARGEIDFKAVGSDENGFVIVPRHAIPHPFSAVREQKARRVITHRYARGDAMELWARGFPAPEVV